MSILTERPRFEDFAVGQKFTSLTRTITETDVVNYAAISGNWHPMHCDIEYAKTTPFGQRIVQGALTYTIAVGLSLNVPAAWGEVIANYGLDEMRFPKPVFINDTIHVEIEIAALTEHKRGGMMSYRFNVINQRGETVCTFAQRVIAKRR